MAIPSNIDYWTFFAGEAQRGHSPLYERLALFIREDEELRAIAAQVRPGQPQANILFGALHFLLLSGISHPLAAHYPSVAYNGPKHGDPGELFRDFCRTHRNEVLRLVESRVTNTNEVARSTCLYPGFDLIARETGQDLHLIEIGPSAGFNLNWDRYRYTFRNGEEKLTRGPSAAHLNVETELRGGLAPPLLPVFPKVLSRVGLELNPVDLKNEQDRLWLKALIWPELCPRFVRLESAIATALEHPQRILSGDALELLEGVANALPAGGAIVIYHSHVTYQFSQPMRARLNATIESLSRVRPIYRVSIEWDEGAYPVNIGRYENGISDKRTIALCDPHGTWLDWRYQ
ncbi:MAG: DUF2332 domain-containing protein [Alphaproteobacteria bacterium]|nr:DUF2332 domain-containing protein [Alphaproteobacteria bacterium]